MHTKPVENLTDHLKRIFSIATTASDENEAARVIGRAAAEIREGINAEKLECAAKLAGRITHRINNPLGAISGNAQLLARRLEKGGR
ncbi:MAG: hypothetical protein Q7T82_01315 [Armatimonadota bacterium]|nr:hypothetical protein [Armatimonadota bacterium]